MDTSIPFEAYPIFGQWPLCRVCYVPPKQCRVNVLLWSDGRTVPFTPTAFSILVLFQQRLFNRKADVYGSSLLLTAKPWLDTSYFHSLYNTIPVFIDYCRISPMETTFMLSPKTDPHPSNCYYTVTTSYNTFPYLWKVWPSRGYSHSRLRTPLLGHMGGISLLWLSYVFAPMRGKSSTCD